MAGDDAGLRRVHYSKSLKVHVGVHVLFVYDWLVGLVSIRLLIQKVLGDQCLLISHLVEGGQVLGLILHFASLEILEQLSSSHTVIINFEQLQVFLAVVDELVHLKQQISLVAQELASDVFVLL